MHFRPATPLSAPLWASAFRPFYLLGTIYGALLMLAWALAYAGMWKLASGGLPLALWHGHEIVFGFASAIIAGVVLTALPSWAGTEEIEGGRLALLVGLWSAGRFACWLSPWIPLPLAAAIDCALFPAVALMVTPQLARVDNRLYLLLLPVLAGLCAGNVVFYAGVADLAAGSEARAILGLRIALYAIVLLYVLKAGVLTPIFTGNILRETKRGADIAFNPVLETLSVVSVVMLAAADLAALPARWIGATALAACIIHALRLARWRGWLVADTPLVFVMHLGYAWLVVAFGLKAAAELGAAVPEAAWLHAFTVGALGLVMLGLMTRVALYHTGRALALPRAIVVAYALMFAATVLRVAVTLLDLGRGAVIGSALLWTAPFLIYLALFGRMLLQPSMPRPQADE